MTSPGAPMPDGAYVIGSQFGQDKWQGSNAATESAIKGQMKSGPLSGFISAQGGFSGIQHIPELTDGQSALEERTDLLDTGYLHLIQSKNWNCPSGGSAKKLPFDRKVGPSKDAIPSNNGIRLLKKGLWRADALLCWQDSDPAGLTNDPSNLFTGNVIAVHRVSDNSLFTRKHYYFTVVGMTDPSSVFWSHEFVVPEDNAYEVSVWVGLAGAFSSRKLYGGIQYTGLWVTQISHDINDPQPNEAVSDGGTLT